MFTEFLDANVSHYTHVCVDSFIQVGSIDYKDDIKKLLRQDRTRLVVSLDDLRTYNREYADG